jgi:hypothetical protein
MRRARVTNRDFNDPLAGRASCRQRRIARFGSLYEEWRTVLFELVFAHRYSTPCGEHRPKAKNLAPADRGLFVFTG